MCCEAPPGFELPQPVAEMLVEYRHLAGRNPLWGETLDHVNAAYIPHLRFVPLEELIGAAITGVINASPDGSMPEWIEAAKQVDMDPVLRDLLGGRLPLGLVALRVGDQSAAGDGGDARLDTGPTLRPVLPDGRCELHVLVDSSAPQPVEVAVAGQEVVVPPGGARLVGVSIEAGDPVVRTTVGGRVVSGRVLDPRPAAKLRMRSETVVRWTVLDEAGAGWFPEQVPVKVDFHGRPFFHGQRVELTVPSGTLTVRCARGLEHRPVEATVVAEPDGEHEVELVPRRRFDPAADGWYGGDLHVHMNYGGEHVCDPATAALMQAGEGLHLMNLVAGNCTTSRVFDRQALESWSGQDLPWSGPEAVARMGVEYRNDLLGHFHALGPSAPPSLYQTGHAASDHPEDWPPNAVAAEELRGHGATIGYCHPVLLGLEDDAPASTVFDLDPRSVEAREVVADAALGLVDSLDVLSNMSSFGAAVLYRHLLGAGLRLAVTAGTDVFLSFAHCGTFSNPPGWARVYARLDGPLGVDAFREAVRAGRTVATNGPWLELEVGGRGPGATVDAVAGQRVPVVARVEGPGVERLEIRTVAGVLASREFGAGHLEANGVQELRAELVVEEPTYVVAVASGLRSHPDVLDRLPFAHTSPVHVHLDGRHVARRSDAEWCLDWLDRLEALARRHGVFHRAEHLDDLVTLLDRARTYYAGVG